MILKQKKTEFELKAQELYLFCEENNIPIFIAGWQPPNKIPTDGYVYYYLPPACIGLDIPDECGHEDKFPLFLRAIAGAWKEDL